MNSSSSGGHTPGQLIDLRDGHGDEVVMVSGEVDLDSAPHLYRDLLNRLRAGSKRIFVDLRNVSFIDSSGLAVLVSARDRAHAIGCRFEVALPLGRARFPFEVTGLISRFESATAV